MENTIHIGFWEVIREVDNKCLETEMDIIGLISRDSWMMGILKAANVLDLPDWWVCAGFVRSKVWDVLHGHWERTPIPDVDVIYFNPDNTDEREEKRYEEQLRELLPHIPWSVKNQARMHLLNENSAYASSVDAMSKFPETVTALGLKLNIHGHLEMAAPHGIHDLVHMQVRPTPFFRESERLWPIYERRINQKNWKSIWTKIDVHHINP